MNEIAENVLAVRARIAEAAGRAGRAPENVTLVAASKMNDTFRVREAIAGGVDAVGENRVQELLQKRAEGAYDGTSLHFIGHLQTNKVKDVVGVCDLIQSAGSARLLAEIGKRAVLLGITQDVLVEVNIGKEEGKSGVLPWEMTEILEKAGEISGVSVLGLMAVPPILDAKGENRRFFDDMMKLFIDIQGKKYDNVSMHYLSMGMSDSYREAIEAGANMIRVGSAIFGARQYN